MNNNKDSMHPEDMRNLILFAVLSLCVWLLYDTYVIKPKRDMLELQKKEYAKAIEKKPDALNMKVLDLEEALAQSPRVAFKNNDIEGSLALKGGRIDDVKLLHYFKALDKKEHVVLLSPEFTKNSRYMDYGWVSEDQTVSLPDDNTIWSVRGDVSRFEINKPLTLYWDNGQGLVFERDVTLDENYVFKISQRVVNNTDKPVKLYPFALVSQTGIPADNHGTWVMHEGPVIFADGALLQKSFQDMMKEPTIGVEATSGWVGISDKYWLTALMPKQDNDTKFRFKFTQNILKAEQNRYQTDFTGGAVDIPAGQTVSYDYDFYAGAKKIAVLEGYEKTLGVKNLGLAVDFGWFWFFTYPFYLALHYITLAVGNIGVSIILMTIAMRMVVYPLTNFSYKSFAKMKKIAPQMSKLREDYKDDKEKLQAAIVELYQKEGVNPLSGCLPILVQIPIFFAFYKTIYVTIDVRHAPFFGWIHDLSAPDPTSIFNLFGLLDYQVPSFLVFGVWPTLMLIAMLIQKELNPPPQDKMQADMMKFFPFFISYMMSHAPSGLVIYWTFSAFISTLQQGYIMRSMGVPIYIFNKEKAIAELEKKVEEGPSVNPLVEMAENEVEKALFEGDNEPTSPIKPVKPKKKSKKKS